ncbi:MAG: uptake protein and related DNA-binding protein-like protein [Cytophagaceae bacterium]|jgi:DNA uptake protein ComE-like DNA-binding protein|nr:uptake protein and related DNA-binding protein-like protein [Cytophagaceae bacterium]
MLRHFFHLGRAYFELDHRQAKAYLWLLFFTAAIVCSPLLTYHFYPAPYSAEDMKLIVRQTMVEDSFPNSSALSTAILFHKRIDRMQETDWLKAGLPLYLAKRISKYEAKVKPLKKINDLYAIYGLDSSRIEQLKPFLEEVEGMTVKAKIRKQDRSFALLDINTVDSISLEALPAIGPVLSKRILKYRELLRGYASKKQYAEIYGISPEALAVLQKWTEIKEIPVVCTIKSADYQKLNAHFYLSGKDARFILLQLKLKAMCWDDLQMGLEPKAQEHIEELKLYYPCN